MKIIEKFELVTGIATCIAVVARFCRFELPELINPNSQVEPMFGIFLFLLFASTFLTLVGVYLHTLCKFPFGLLFLLIGSGYLVLINVYYFLLAFFFMPITTTATFVLLPGLLAATTIFCALYPRKT